MSSFPVAHSLPNESNFLVKSLPKFLIGSIPVLSPPTSLFPPVPFLPPQTRLLFPVGFKLAVEEPFQFF